MTNNSAYVFLNNFSRLEALSGFLLSVKLNKLKRDCEKAIKTLEDGKKYTKEYSQYLQERLDLAKTFADTDPETKLPLFIPDTPGSKTGIYRLAINRDQWNKELDKLNKKYKEAIDEQNEKLVDFNEALGNEIDVSDKPELIDPKILFAKEKNKAILKTDILNIIYDFVDWEKISEEELKSMDEEPKG